MSQQDTLGLERLGIGKTLGENARRKARARFAVEKQQPLLHNQSIGAVNQDETIEPLKILPAIPSYQALPIPPLGSVTSHSTGQPAPRFSPSAGRAAPDLFSNRCPPGYTSKGTQGATSYQSGQGFSPINGPMLDAHTSSAQRVQPINPLVGPINAGSGVHKSLGVATIRKSPLSVVSYHGLPSLRIDKQYRHSKARRPQVSPSTPLGQASSLSTTHQQNVTQVPRSLHSKTKELTRPVNHNTSLLTKGSLIHLPAPLPTAEYLKLAHSALSLLPSPQRLLLVLDLNGTLLYRSSHIQYLPRPCLKNFLKYALANHSVLIWSSATPKSVKGMCERLFNPAQRRLLLGEWGRDRLGLTPVQYKERVQVYKRLDYIWYNESFQCTHPGFANGEKWGQHNTFLIDDSMMKASAQPFNHIEVPEFLQGAKEAKGGGKPVLEQVVGYLEYARRWSDVSGFVREVKFGVGEGWSWDWVEGAAQRPEIINDDEDDDGGVKL